MSFRARLAALERWQKLLLSLSLFLSVYAAFGFLVLPRVVRDLAVDSVQESLSRSPTLGDVRINPFLLTLDVEGFSLPDRDGADFVRFAALHADFELSSIFRGAVTFREIRLVEPYVHVKVLEGGDLNFGDILRAMEADAAADENEDEETAAGEGGAPPLLVQLAAIEAGRIVFSDRSRPTPFEYEISPLDIELRDFGTRPDDESPYSFTATTGAGEALEWQGNVSVVPLHSKGRLVLTGVRPRTGWLYVQDDVLFEVVDGTIDIEAQYDLDARDELALKLEDGSIRVRDFAVADRESGQSTLSIAAFDVEGIELAYPEQRVRISSLRSRGGFHHLLRLEDGTLRVEELARARGGEGRGESAPGEVAGSEGSGSAEPRAADEAPAWSVMLAEVEFADYRIDFEDRSTDPPVRVPIAPITLRLTDVRADPAHPIDLQLELAIDEGRARVEGPVRAAPLDADLAIEIEALDLRAFEPYWTAFADVDMTSGRLGAGGHLALSVEEGGDPAVAWSGDLRVDALETLDRSRRSRLVSWQALELSSLDVAGAGVGSLSLERLRLVEPAVHFALASDGSSNFSRVSVESAAAPAPPPQAESAPAGPAPRVAIGRVEIERGAATFEDRTVEPHFETGITRLGGHIAGLSSDREARAAVVFEALLDGATPMKIDGEMSPLAEQTHVDLRLGFENFELSPLTPYSGRHIGQTIDRGKLFLDVAYVLGDRKIRGENKLLLDQFTLGERVESEDAVNLPVGLAIALLQDRNGEIHIDLPVTGDIDDPEFGFGRMIFGALGTLITKVALSPFAMLEGFGGDDATRSIVFDSGRAAVAPAELAKLDALAKALTERPALLLEVTGGASAALDRPVLQADALDVALRRARLLELQSRWFGEKPETIEEIALEPDQRRRLLEERYAAIFGEEPQVGVLPEVAAKPVTPTGEPDEAALETAWLETLQRRLAGEIEVDESALRQLARRRSEAVRDYLVQQGGVPPERVYVLDVEIDETGDGEAPSALLSLAAG